MSGEALNPAGGPARVRFDSNVSTLAANPDQDGQLRIRPATFLERWGTVFVASGLVWLLVVSSVLLVYFLRHLPPFPAENGATADSVRSSLEVHKQVYDQYRQSISDIFDLLVTRTVLPLLTLLLGYVFGRTPNRSL